jgi:GT2 family glycosyltransferase
LHVLVVDNASTDDSVERIREAFPATELLQADANLGFAAGCNLGARLALERGAAFVWLLNNDTIAPPDTLTKLVAAASGPKTGMVGTVLHYAHNPTEIQAWGGGSIVRSIGYGTHFLAPAPLGPNSFLTFASVLLRRELFEAIGFLDEGFFMYFEDSDLCFRARAAGWQFAVAPDTAVLHKEGGSTDLHPRRSARTDRIVTASGLRFLRRYGQPRSVAPLLFVLSKLGKRILLADFAGARAVVRGTVDWWHDRPTAFQREP